MILLKRKERLQEPNPSQITTSRTRHQRWEWTLAYYKKCPTSQIMSNFIQVSLYKKGFPANKKSKMEKNILHNRTNHPWMNSLWVIYSIYNYERIPLQE